MYRVTRLSARACWCVRARTVFPGGNPRNLAAEFPHQKPHTVTNSQDRDAQVKNVRMTLGGAGIIARARTCANTPRSSGKNYPPGGQCFQFFRRGVSGQNLTENLCLPDLPG